MKYLNNISRLSLVLFILLMIISCDKEYQQINFNDDISNGTYTDSRDGTTYRTVSIGNQAWMAENLNYNPEKSTDGDIYSRFYYWRDIYEAVPAGWHLPSEDEVQELIDFLGGNSVAGGKLKETGIVHWQNPNSGASNSSGFTALPAGIWDGNSGCYAREKWACFWIPDPEEVYNSKYLVLYHDSENAEIIDDPHQDNAMSIRLIKDN